MLRLSARRSVMAALLAGSSLYISGFGCSGETFPLPDTEMLARDSQYMSTIFDQQPDGLGFVKIDLADDRQYQAVVNRLLFSGNTPDNSPELFARIEADRAAAVDRAQGHDGTVGTASSAFTGPAWCAHILPTTEATKPGTSYFNVNPQVSCWGGADYVYADTSGYASTQDQSSMTYLTFNSGEQYGNGMNFKDVSISPTIDVGGIKSMLYAESYVMAYDFETGESQYTYAAIRTTAGAPPFNAAGSLQPLDNSLPPTPVGCLTNVHPRDLIDDPSSALDDAKTRVCLERGIVSGNLDCDYATVDNSFNPVWVSAPSIRGIAGINTAASLAAVPKKWIAQTTAIPPNEPSAFDWPTVPAGTYDLTKLYVPMRGRYDATAAYGGGGTNCKIVEWVPTFTNATLILEDIGGWCAGGTSTKTGLTAGLPTVNGTQAAAQLNLLGNFGPDCVGYQQNTRLTMTIQAKLKCDGMQTPVAKFCTQIVSKLDFKNSCFAEGTEIVRADGTKVPVEDIQIGDKVLSSNTGRQLSVVSIARGGERHPLVNIYDADGHDLFLTEKHPVVTANKGVVFAEEVVEGDLVYTQNGVSPVVAVSRVAYDREVFNLSLGTPEELATIQKDERTMFAGGILVGDGALQTEMEAAATNPPKGDIMTRLSAAWKRDYVNDVARGAAVFD